MRTQICACDERQQRDCEVSSIGGDRRDAEEQAQHRCVDRVAHERGGAAAGSTDGRCPRQPRNADSGQRPRTGPRRYSARNSTARARRAPAQPERAHDAGPPPAPHTRAPQQQPHRHRGSPSAAWLQLSKRKRQEPGDEALSENIWAGTEMVHRGGGQESLRPPAVPDQHDRADLLRLALLRLRRCRRSRTFSCRSWNGCCAGSCGGLTR